MSSATPADPLTAILAAPPRPHPRLLLPADGIAPLRQRIADDAQLQRVLAAIAKRAEADLVEPPLRRELVGRRLLDVSRECLARVLRLSLLWRIGGDRRHLARAQQEMLAAAGFSDWNPSHFLDTAEMTAALAIGYDWLFDDLDAQTRLTVRRAIVSKGLLAFKGNRGINNWNPVCNGGMALGALAVIEDEPELARRIVAQAVADVPMALRDYEPDGVYPEGPMYWSYGTSFHVLMVAALESALATDAGLVTPALTASAEYYAHMVGPTGRFFNYGDCKEHADIEPVLAWFAARGGKGAAWALRGSLERVALDRRNRLLPLLLLWSRPGADAAPPDRSHYVGRGRTPVATHRSGWEADAAWVAIKGGSPSSNHAHMDAGSFVIDGEGVRWAGDLGMQDYHSLESQQIRLWDMSQESQRWSVFRLGTSSHSVPMADGGQQQVEGMATIAAHDAAATIIDLTPLYDRRLVSLRRGIRLLPDRSVLIHDEAAALPGKPAIIRWAMLTGCDAVLRDGRTAVLRKSGKERTLRLLAPADAILRLIPADPPPQPFDAPNPGYRLVTCEAALPAGGQGALIVHLAPPGAAAPQATPPLGDWMAKP